MTNEQIISKLIENNISISTAESCTGGSLGKIITSVPGASSIYGYGFITYANEAKEKLLGVPHEVLETIGAVSSETALYMAEGARGESGSDIADKNGSEYRKLNLTGDRDEVRRKTCDEVFSLVNERLGF